MTKEAKQGKPHFYWPAEFMRMGQEAMDAAQTEARQRVVLKSSMEVSEPDFLTMAPLIKVFE